ncbi:hypothetical protein [Lichenibacterium ramalinae]|uniref:Uncharacterized protein n=1 Tax=Lichenibacterium ramalinae TaxID=2316527 RepID=A0A4Q2RH94_9HYPH|nr:hypothetical protein [Lichenibacterium ramalinae]RYB07084.1 hypothetical protein D3272_03145 [Lichenibacterium ramalinae]
MTSFITKVALAPVAASLALMLSASAPASAQSSLTNGPDGMQPNTLRSNGHTPRMARRPLTVRRAGAPVVAAAPVAAPAPVGNPISGVLGVGSTVVGLPFQVLGGIFPADASVRKGGVTAVRYVGTGAKQAEIDEGWSVAVPVDRSGPIFVVANGDPTVSPITFIGQPLRAVGTIAQTPFRVIGAPFGGPAAF